MADRRGDHEKHCAEIRPPWKLSQSMLKAPLVSGYKTLPIPEPSADTNVELLNKYGPSPPLAL